MYEQRFYRGLPCFGGDRSGVFTVGCLLVHPEHRKQGVASALIHSCAQTVQTWGGRAIEAFPRVVEGAVSDEELWTGPARAFLEAGFTAVSDTRPYPVVRLILTNGLFEYYCP